MWVLTANSESGDDFGAIEWWDQKDKPSEEEVNRVLVERGTCDCQPCDDPEYDGGPNDFELDGVHYANYIHTSLWELGESHG